MGQAKRRGSLEDRIRQATMPSFHRELKTKVTAGALKITYDRSGLTDQQCKFADDGIAGLMQQQHKWGDKKHLRGTVHFGTSKDCGAMMVELTKKQLKEWPALLQEYKDMFLSQYWATTNQPVHISKTYLDKIIKGTAPQPIGVKLSDVPANGYTNFAIAVAYTYRSMQVAKKSIGDLCPPEATPGNSLYNTEFIAKVKEALSYLGTYVECDWQPGKMITTRLEKADLQ